MNKAILLLVAFTAFSCSSSDNGSEPILPDAMTINGVPIEIISQSSTYYYNNYFEVRMVTSSHLDINILFDKYGNFIRAETNQTSEFFASYPYFSSNYFNFELKSINIAKGKCVIDFSGPIYEDRYDMNSNSATLSGHLNLKVWFTQPGSDFNQNSGIFAQVDGKNWFSPTPVTYSADDYFKNSYSVCDDEYRLVFNTSGTNTPIGQYDFTEATLHNCVKVEKFDTTTLSYKLWKTQGNMKITNKTQPYQYGYYMYGTFSLTASNPENSAETVHFKNGIFNTLKM